MSSDARTSKKTAPAAGRSPGGTAPLHQWLLTVRVRLKDAGPIVESEPVVRRDFDDVLAELSFHACWRRGEPGRSLDTMDVQCAAHFIPDAADGGLITGYELRGAGPGGEPCRRSFTVLSLQWAAERAVNRLVAAGRMKVGTPYLYDLHARRRDPGNALGDPGPAPVPMTTVRRDPPLRWLLVDPQRLLDGARAVGPHNDPHHDPSDWSQVFYTEAARIQAERLSRLGAQRTPAVESGAALFGTLCMCPTTGDMFVVVTHALEVFDAQSTTFSLEYSSRSWQRIMTVIEAMRQQPETSTLRLLGQAHGHNFMPAAGAPPCELCTNAANCGRTSVFVSQEDLIWTRAVFSGQPYALSHIHGLSARHMRPDPDEVEGLYGLRDGRLLPRGYHVIDRFDPLHWPQDSTADDRE